MPNAFVTMVVLCREVRQNSEGFIDLLGVVPDSIVLIDEPPGELRLTAVVRVFAEAAGEYPFRAGFQSPRGAAAGPLIEWGMDFHHPETSREVLVDVEFRPDEAGLYWFVVSVGPGTATKVPLEVRWAPDSRPAN